jgi:hypothetical protein
MLYKKNISNLIPAKQITTTPTDWLQLYLNFIKFAPRQKNIQIKNPNQVEVIYRNLWHIHHFATSF